MLVHPKPGARVRIRYRTVLRDFMPYHDKTGTVEIVSKGPGPRPDGNSTARADANRDGRTM